MERVTDGSETNKVEAAEEDFAGFDGSWGLEWVDTLESLGEQIPWTWIAVILFVGCMVYSFYRNKNAK